jgi:8-oxo-dGTP diphosphatase
MIQQKHTGVYALAVLQNKVLLIQKARGPYTGKWDLPGGSLEFGEEPLDGLKREVMEETGLIVKKADLLEVLSHVVTYESLSGEQREMHHLGIIYKVELDLSNALKTEADGEDSNGARWIDLSGLSLDELSPFAKRCVK